MLGRRPQEREHQGVPGAVLLFAGAARDTGAPMICKSAIVGRRCNQRSAPEVFKPRLAQLGVSRGVRDQDVPEPVLNGADVDAVVGQLVAAAVPQHVEMDGQGEAGALADQL
jgi:hypothetical protein